MLLKIVCFVCAYTAVAITQKSIKIHKIYMGENRLHAQEVVIVVGIVKVITLSCMYAACEPYKLTILH